MDEAQYFYDEYAKLIDEIIKHQLDSNLSIKPTAFGLLIDQKGLKNSKSSENGVAA